MRGPAYLVSRSLTDGETETSDLFRVLIRVFAGYGNGNAPRRATEPVWLKYSAVLQDAAQTSVLRRNLDRTAA